MVDSRVERIKKKRKTLCGLIYHKLRRVKNKNNNNKQTKKKKRRKRSREVWLIKPDSEKALFFVTVCFMICY